MGWTIAKRKPGETAAEFLKKEHGAWWDHHVVKHEHKGISLFMLARYTPEDSDYAWLGTIFEPNDKGEILTIAICVYDTHGNSIKYKQLCEFQGPRGLNGPPALIKLASNILPGGDGTPRQFARDWRERSLKKAEGRV